MEKGYIEPVPKAEEDQGWYLPFFNVVKRQKSTPICLVFDAKAKHRGTSLNNQILDTPNRLNDHSLNQDEAVLLCPSRRHNRDVPTDQAKSGGQAVPPICTQGSSLPMDPCWTLKKRND